ncbi:AAA-type ATPase family protein [Striga hermonthica]|uniref:microtubule-severing ATPase n=1 Tax=Striga hermonthica TaxID=68872 RepID=A0A9N7RSD0_STRHE|nr:AAA-type ATPase family protein [Striga hermonthica]
MTTLPQALPTSKYPKASTTSLKSNGPTGSMTGFTASISHFPNMASNFDKPECRAFGFEGRVISAPYRNQLGDGDEFQTRALIIKQRNAQFSGETVMSFLKEIIENFSSIFSDSVQSQQSSSSTATGNGAMDGEGGVSTGNERTAYKLKGYFELAKEEIAKAVRAEEWGLPDDAITRYKNAQRIFTEAISTPVPSYISSSELEKVKSYRQKISKWQGQVAERLQTLSQRTGISPEIKSTSSKSQTGAVSCTFSHPRKMAVQRSSGQSSGPIVNSPANNAKTSRPIATTGGGYDAKLVEMINSVIIDQSPSVKWDDIAGLETAKQALMEMVILPTKRRDLFTGLRKPAKGLLLFGPPGTGKTLLAKAVASESDATFFSVSASSLTSKWVGEGEKLVRTLFQVAIARQPSVIFMDEIDSIMSTRTENENEASRRLKSEFLVQFDGVTSSSGDLITVIGATNKPQELDDAVLRRLVKRIYIPLPDRNARGVLLKHKLKGNAFSLPDRDLERLVAETDGYSGSDLQALCEEAAMMPIRELGSNILTVQANQVRGLRYGDFQKAMTVIRPSLQKSKWKELEKWNREFGSN